MRYRYILFILSICCFTLRLSAQQVYTIKGVISKNLSGERIAQVLITNLRSKDIMESDELGWFSIKAAIGDTLLFNKKDFTSQKVAVINSGDMPVYMHPVIVLQQVTIQGQTKKQELASYEKEYTRKGVYYDGKPPLSSILLNPLNDLHNLFGKDAKDLRRFQADAKSEIEFAEVHRRYNLAFVKRVTNANDTVAQRFMEYYTPSFQDLKEWNDYELIKHVHANYDFYDKTADKESLRKKVLQPLLPTSDKKSLEKD